MSGKKSLTATNLAVHQHLKCDLYIHNVYNRAAPVSGQGPVAENTPDELEKAHFKRGLDWEASLYAWLDESGLLLQVPAMPLAAGILLENILADDRTHFFITGLSFWPPQSKLNERFVQAGTEPLKFGLAKPDLVEIRRMNNIIQWRVIDAKASKNVTTSHHIQIYFYTLCLSYLLEPPFFQIAETSGIWLPPKDGFQTSSPSVADIKTVSVSFLAPALDALLFRELPKIIFLPDAKVKWHYNPLCHGCPYTKRCRARAEEEGQLGKMPNLSIDDAVVLKDILRISRSSGFRNADMRLTDIEELHELLANPTRMDQVAKASPTLLKKGKCILSLPKKLYHRNAALQSPLVEAARTQEIQIIRQRNHTCPSREDIAVILSIINDPSSANPGGDFFCATLHSEDSDVILPASFACSADEFVSRLATLIRSLSALHLDNSRRYSSQFYVWTTAEQTLLQAHIINAALRPDTNSADIRLCIGALAQGASLLQTTFQPILLSGALISFIGKGKKFRSEYQACLARMGLSTDGTVEVLSKRLDEGIRQIRDEMASTSRHEHRRREFGRLPRVVSVMKEIQRQMALPIPGYWNLPECAKLLLPLEKACPSDEQIFAMYKAGDDSEAFSNVLFGRNLFIHSVLKEFRRRVVSSANHALFINEAKIISTNFMDICKEPHIRKLFFMQQFEVLAKLTDLWKSRIDGCPEAPTLEYSNVVQGPNGLEYVFRLVSGTVDVPAFDRDWAFYDKLLVLDSSESTNNGTDPGSLPVEALFDDLGVSGLVFPLNRWTKANWGQQHPRVQRELVVADVRNVYTDKNAASTMVALRIWGNWQMSLTPGLVFRLSQRLVDFNTSKILSALFEIDLLWESEGDLYADEEDDGHHSVPFLQLITNPNSFGRIHGAKKYVKTEGEVQKLFRDLKALGNNIAGSLVLKSSQHKAARRILSNRLSVVWGPPGTGKTYTISLSLLRLIEVERRYSGPRRRIIFITAITHAAIEACRSKLVRLMDAYRSIESLPHKWLDEVKVEVVSRGSDHPGPSRSDSGIYIYAGTLFQLSNFTKRYSFQVDCVIADEAGQISLGAISLVLRSLTVEGRIIFAGDSEQLAPILSAQYPQLKFSSLFGSVLDCLMFFSDPIRREDSQVLQASQEEGSEFPASQSQNAVVQLTENFRLNPDLGEFVSTIYSRRFRPQKVQTRQLATALKSLSEISDSYSGIQPTVLKNIRTFFVALSEVMLKQPQTVLVAPEVQSTSQARLPPGIAEVPLTHRPVSLALIRLRSWSSHTQHIGYESHVHAEAAVAAALVTLLQKCSPNEDIFVATPHRIQREAVNSALARIEMEDDVRELEAEFGRMDIQQSYFTRSKVTVDTIERLQGSEAAYVICLFSLPRGYTADLGFLLERRRLNVAISRAKTLCILVSSDEVLCPSVKILAEQEPAKGYAFLKAFEKRAWSYNLAVNTDKISI